MVNLKCDEHSKNTPHIFLQPAKEICYINEDASLEHPVGIYVQGGAQTPMPPRIVWRKTKKCECVMNDDTIEIDSMVRVATGLDTRFSCPCPSVSSPELSKSSSGEVKKYQLESRR